MPKIYGNTEILGGDLTVLGNMVISGTQTSLNVEELNVADNIIVLNATFSGSPVLDSGIEINRGSSTNARLIWNESTDYWVAGLSGSESTLVTNASNGLTKTNDGILLGGTLTQNTNINNNSNYLNIEGGDVYFSTSGSVGTSFQFSGDPAIFAIGGPYNVHYVHIIDNNSGSNLLIGERSDTLDPIFRFKRDVSTGTIGSGGRTIPNGESLGSLIWTGNNKDTGATESSIINSSITGGNGYYSEIGFSTRGVDGLNQRMVLDESGNLGIGTNTPSYNLEVSGQTLTSGRIRKTQASAGLSYSISVNDNVIIGTPGGVVATYSLPNGAPSGTEIIITKQQSGTISLITTGGETMAKDNSGGLTTYNWNPSIYARLTAIKINSFWLLQ